jgi:hypothetical protein
VTGVQTCALPIYLDIFRGVNTRKQRNNNGNAWYYDHPFFDGEKPKLEKKPCIKYIMIGEARPKPNPPLKNDCSPINGDENNSFFYNIKHVKYNTPQF